MWLFAVILDGSGGFIKLPQLLWWVIDRSRALRYCIANSSEVTKFRGS